MLSGLVRNESATDVAKVPLLGQIPVIGELFKSRSFRENKTELAIFITPTESVGSKSEDQDRWISSARKEAEEHRFRLVD